MTTVFNLPVVYQHNKAENIRLMLETLNKLEMISNTIFNSIEKKIDERTKNLTNIQKRIVKTRKLVTNLKLRKEATIVFSPNHTHEVDDKEEFVFKEKDFAIPKLHKIVSQPEGFEESNKYNDPERYYHEKKLREEQLRNKSSKRKKKDDPNKKYFSDIGLGKLPNKIESVSSFMIFNSNSNCYFNYDTSFDPLLGENIDDEDEEEMTGIEDPIPPSMTGEVSVFSYDNVGLKFKPKSRKHKEMRNVGLGLTNVATLKWDDGFDDPDDSLLPSAHIPDLPDVETQLANEGEAPTINTGDDETDGDVPEPPGMDGDVPPPDDDGESSSDDDDDDDDMPPPPDMDGINDSKKKEGGDDDEYVDEEVEDGAAAKKAAPAPVGKDDFLASIRNFAKNKLKKVDIKIGKKKKNLKKNVAAPTSFMGQLSQELARRRRAMQGIKEDEDERREQKKSFGEEEIKRPKRPEEEEESVKLPQKEGETIAKVEEVPNMEEKAVDEWSDEEGDGDDGWDD